MESEDDEQLAKVDKEDSEEPAKVQPEEDDEQHSKVQLEEDDEQLAKAIQESLNMDSPPRYDHSNIFQPPPFFQPTGHR